MIIELVESHDYVDSIEFVAIQYFCGLIVKEDHLKLFWKHKLQAGMFELSYARLGTGRRLSWVNHIVLVNNVCRVRYLKGRPDWVQPRPVATTSATSATLALQFKYQPCRVTTVSNQASPPRSSPTTHLHRLHLSPTSTPITSLLAGNADAATTSSTLNFTRKSQFSSLH